MKKITLLGLLTAFAAFSTAEKAMCQTTPELVFYYGFNGNYDCESDHAITAEPYQAPTFSEGKYGQALHLDKAQKQYVDLNGSENLISPGTDDITACAWFKNETSPTTAKVEEQILIQKDGANDAVGRVYVSVRYVNNQSYFTNLICKVQNPSGADAFTSNDWHHVAMVYNKEAATVSWYVDGELNNTVQTGADQQNYKLEPCTGGFRIGHHKSLEEYWNGDIDELYLFKGVLNEDDIKKVMNNTYFTSTGILNNQTKSMAITYDEGTQTVKANGEYDIKSMAIFSTIGSKISSKEGTNEISVAGLSKGLYLIKAINSKGEEITGKVLVK